MIYVKYPHLGLKVLYFLDKNVDRWNKLLFIVLVLCFLFFDHCAKYSKLYWQYKGKESIKQFVSEEESVRVYLSNDVIPFFARIHVV